MSTDALKIAEINEGDQAFAKLVTNQVSRVTQEMLKLEQLLKAGMVDPSALKAFRKAVDEIRKTSWAVQQSLTAITRPPKDVAEWLDKDPLRSS
jgi:hypothetical protein